MSRLKKRGLIGAGTALAVMGVAMPLMASTASALTDDNGTVTLTTSATTNLVDGNTVSLTATGDGRHSLTNMTAHLCVHNPNPGGLPPGISVNAQFVPGGGFCTTTSFGSSSGEVSINIDPAVSSGTINFTVGVGSAGPVTCSAASPCDLYLREDTDQGFLFEQIPLTFLAVTPSAPRNVTATGSGAGNHTANLSWTAPSTVGSGVTDYIVTPIKNGVNQTPIDLGGPALSTSVPGLVDGASYTFKVAAVSSGGTGPTSAATSPAITPSLVFTSGTTAAFLPSTAGSFTISTVGNPTAAITIASATTTALPSWLHLTDNGNGTATLSGTPTATLKTYAATVTATSSAASATQSLNIVVGTAPAITSVNTGTLTVGKASALKLVASGTPKPVLSSTGTLPAGITFSDIGNGYGQFIGTPAAGSGGSYPLTITATNPEGSTSQSYTLVVDELPTFTSAPGLVTHENTPINVTITTGHVYPAGVAISTTTILPAWLTLTDNGNGTATLSGTAPTLSAKLYKIALVDTGALKTVKQTFSLEIDAAPTFTSLPTATATIGIAKTVSIKTKGYPIAALSYTGTLPAGFTFTDGGKGIATIVGTATAGQGGSYPLTIKATNSQGTTFQSFTLVIPEPPTFTNAAAATFHESSSNSFTFTTSFAYPAVVLSTTSTLPPGVTLTDNGDGTATLSGTPTGALKVYKLTVTALSGTKKVTQTFMLTVAA
jgi:hypothetical protein